MHEQTVTIKLSDGQFQVVTKDGKPVSDPFPTQKQADDYAQQRSENFGRLLDDTLERHRQAEEMIGRKLPTGRITRY